MSPSVFDQLAERYDAWFDTSRGSASLSAELACLRTLMPRDTSGWIEVGVGSGRFTAALGIGEGVDPSSPMLQKAVARGIRMIVAEAESLPYASRSLQGILLVVTLCFLSEPEVALRECARVLKEDGELLVGIVPSDSSWGEYYRFKGSQGHPFYSVARFYTCDEAAEMAMSAGFQLLGAASTLPMGPDEPLEDIPVLDGVCPECGFVGMLFGLHSPKPGP